MRQCPNRWFSGHRGFRGLPAFLQAPMLSPGDPGGSFFAGSPGYTEFSAFGYPILATAPHPLLVLHPIIAQLSEKKNVNLIFWRKYDTIGKNQCAAPAHPVRRQAEGIYDAYTGMPPFRLQGLCRHGAAGYGAKCQYLCLLYQEPQRQQRQGGKPRGCGQSPGTAEGQRLRPPGCPRGLHHEPVLCQGGGPGLCGGGPGGRSAPDGGAAGELL